MATRGSWDRRYYLAPTNGPSTTHRVIERYPNNGKLLRVYGKFLEDVKHDAPAAQRVYAEVCGRGGGGGSARRGLLTCCMCGTAARASNPLHLFICLVTCCYSLCSVPGASAMAGRAQAARNGGGDAIMSLDLSAIQVFGWHDGQSALGKILPGSGACSVSSIRHGASGHTHDVLCFSRLTTVTTCVPPPSPPALAP